jgi:hypothetical protein
VVNGVLTSPKERRSFKPEVESSILSGRIPLPSKQRRSVPIAEPNPRLLLESPFRARPGDSSPFREVVVASWSHFWVVAVGE